jgi:hypothetical protein
MSRFNTMRTRGGGVVQAGLDMQVRPTGHAPLDPTGVHRGIVLETFCPKTGPGTADTDFNADNFRKLQVECTVLLVKSQIYLKQVPVRQPFYGVNNAHTWVPKPTTRVISGTRTLHFRPRSARGSRDPAAGPVPAFDDLDGDMVLVEFMDNEIDSPIITGAITHEQANRRIIQSGTGWSEATAALKRGHPEENEYYLHYKGAEVRINDDGEVLIDTVGAYTDPVTETPTADKGQVRVRVKDNLKFTVECDGVDVLEVFKDGGGVHVHLGEAATESILKGDAFKTLYDAHTHPSPAGGSTGPPAVKLDVPAGTHLSTQHKTR